MDRPTHLRIRCWPQPTHRPIHWSERQHSPARVRSKPGREAAHTQLDIDRNHGLLEAARAQVFSDVDAAYATVNGAVILLKPYKAQYLQQALSVRDTISFSYQHGAASLLDFLNAQADYRSVQVNYPESDCLLSRCCRPAESCCRTRGDPMNRRQFAIFTLSLTLGLFAVGCSKDQSNPGAEAPPPLKLDQVQGSETSSKSIVRSGSI